MGRIVSIHSYRGGTGKSNLTANLAWQLAARGRKVAVLDTDLQSPGVHIVLQLDPARLTHTLSDLLFGGCEIEDAAYAMTAELPMLTTAVSQILLVVVRPDTPNATAERSSATSKPAARSRATTSRRTSVIRCWPCQNRSRSCVVRSPR